MKKARGASVRSVTEFGESARLSLERAHEFPAPIRVATAAAAKSLMEFGTRPVKPHLYSGQRQMQALADCPVFQLFQLAHRVNFEIAGRQLPDKIQVAFDHFFVLETLIRRNTARIRHLAERISPVS